MMEHPILARLSGYLVTRPTGAFGRLKGKKRQWFVFDDQNHLLKYYASESDVTKTTPLGTIALQNAAIAIILEEDNSFVIHTEGKDCILSAESHSSMMTWVFALQAKRSRCMGEERFTSLKVTANRSHNRTFGRAQSFNHKRPDDSAKFSWKPLLRRRTTQLTCTSTVGRSDSMDKNNNERMKEDEEDASGRSQGEEDSSSESQLQRTSSRELSDHVEEKVGFLRHLNLDMKKPNAAKERSGSLSGTSISGDSAIGHTSPCIHSRRIAQMENELMSVKCDLAKAMNRSTYYKNRFAENETLLARLQDKFFTLQAIPTFSSSSNLPAKVYENHNRFLNEEVLKLSNQLQEQEHKYQTQQCYAKELEEAVEQLKRDYVYLIQSALKVTCQGGTEAADIYMFGRKQHKERIISLLNEARMVNPTLPTIDSSSDCLCHVDALGFQHCYTEESSIVHYAAQQLHQHYAIRVQEYQIHQLRWKEYIRKNGIALKQTELKKLVRRGIPNPLRSRVWCYLYRGRVRLLMEQKGPHYYNQLCSLVPDSKAAAVNKRQISLDLLRTMPSNVRFSHQNADGVLKMQEVLQAFCVHNPELGYCQGMNFLVAVCLLFMDAEDAFWCLVAIVEKYFPSGYFDMNLIGAQTDQEVLKDTLKEKLPALNEHINSFDIDLCTITLNWFLSVFFESAPFETVLRIWDCFLLEGPKVIFRFALAVLKLQEDVILAQTDGVSVMKQLKASVKASFDVDRLMEVAFDELEPFPNRKELAAKRAYYFKNISERIRRIDEERRQKSLKRKVSKSQFNLTVNLDHCHTKPTTIECGTSYESDGAILCYSSSDNETFVAKVNCEENFMYNIDIQLGSRVTTVHFVQDAVLVFGTISQDVIAYSTKSKSSLWSVRLNDSVLCLLHTSVEKKEFICAGLADGTLAVLQCSHGCATLILDTFYVSVGSSPVRCLAVVEEKVWCGSGNRLVIVGPRTFDVEDTFQTSTNGMDHISLVVPGTGGVWVSLRNSSTIQLWDPSDLCCKVHLDVPTHSSPFRRKEDALVPSLTAVLQINNNLIIGTDEGVLLFYELSPPVIRKFLPADNVKIFQPEGDNNDNEQNEIPAEDWDRRRNDSGCYSTTTAPNVSRRESIIGCNADFERFQISFPDETPEETLANDSTPLPCSELYLPDVTITSTEEINSPTKCGLAEFENSAPSVEKRNNLRTFKSYLRKCNSVPDFRRRALPRSVINLSMSVDGLVCRRGTSAETLSSMTNTSDGYEYDDFFATYTDDEFVRPFCGLRRASAANQPWDGKVPDWSMSWQRQNSCGRVRFLSDQSVGLWSNAESVFGDEDNVSRYLELPSVPTFTWDSRGCSTNDASFEDDSTTPTEQSQSCQLELNLLTVSDRLKRSSDTASVLSMASIDPTSTMELILAGKFKISEKPIKCLLQSKRGDEPMVISCAGVFSEAESVLKWTRDSKQKTWSNEPIIEVCPFTKQVRNGNTLTVRGRSSSMDTRQNSILEVNRSLRSSSAAGTMTMFSSSFEKLQALFGKQNESKNIKGKTERTEAKGQTVS